VAWLPASLPQRLPVLWSVDLPSDGLSGLAAAEGVVIAACRDVTDTRDVFVCLDAETGAPKWKHQYPAPCSFDYGNAPRATPVIGVGRVWTQGAAGHVHCLDLKSGAMIWQKNIAAEFGTPRLEWGLTGSPLLVDGKLIVQPGGRVANIVALQADTGAVVWRSEPGLPGHSSFITASLGGTRQIIGYDEASLGGWELQTGKRLWGIVPKVKGDFNVPTPLIVDNHVVVATENNATRSYRIGDDGRPAASPTAQFKSLSPDSSSPVSIGDRVYGLTDGLFCLDVANGLKQAWLVEDDALIGYGSVIACPSLRRVLVLTLGAKLLVVQDEGTSGRILANIPLGNEDSETHSHPAMVGDVIYVRIGDRLSAMSLSSAT
jgi:outer membrane protein assembly factor BamB